MTRCRRSLATGIKERPFLETFWPIVLRNIVGIPGGTEQREKTRLVLIVILMTTWPQEASCYSCMESTQFSLPMEIVDQKKKWQMWARCVVFIGQGLKNCKNGTRQYWDHMCCQGIHHLFIAMGKGDVAELQLLQQRTGLNQDDLAVLSIFIQRLRTGSGTYPLIMHSITWLLTGSAALSWWAKVG